MEEVICTTSVIIPIWRNEKPYSSLNIGYTEGITDCIRSFRKCPKLIAINIGNTTLPFSADGSVLILNSHVSDFFIAVKTVSDRKITSKNRYVQPVSSSAIPATTGTSIA